MAVTQEQFIRRILELKELNPEFPIHFMTSADSEEDYSLQHITDVSVLPWFVVPGNGRDIVYTDEETIRDLLSMEEGTDKEEQYRLRVSLAIVVSTGWEEPETERAPSRLPLMGEYRDE